MARDPNSQSDATLVQACLDGQSRAWDLLIRRYRRLVYSVPVAYGLAPEHADDVFQRVALRLFERLHQLKRTESLPAWLTTTTRRECQALLAGSRRLGPLPDRENPELSEDPPDVARKLDRKSVLVLLAILGPRLSGSPDPPSFAASAVQLLPPGTVVQEARIQGGGFVRAREIVTDDAGLRLRGDSAWRPIRGVRTDGVTREVRLWLGTDHQGRDLLARMVHGARVTLVVALVATLVAVLLGTFLGLSASVAPPAVRAIVEIVTDGLLGLPRLLLLLILGVTLRGSSPGIGLAIGLASWMEISRLVQAESLRLRGMPFVFAVEAVGASRMRLALCHLFPNLLPILTVMTPLVATQAIILEATLSYIGVADGGRASWGSIVSDGQRLLPAGWWVAVAPGMLLCMTALAIHGLARSEPPRQGDPASS